MSLPLSLMLSMLIQTAPGTILIDRNRVDHRPPAAVPLAVPPAKPPSRITDAGSSTPIAGIRFGGAKAPAAVAAAARPFIGRSASRATLTELAAALSAAYGHSPIALYTVAILDQDLAHGVVTVSLTEGRIAKAQVRTGRADRYGLLRRRMAPLTAEAPLTRVTFERQFSLMRAIPGLTFDTALTDPAADGRLTLTVTPKQRRTKVTGGFSSRGIQGLGDGQFDARGELYGLATDGDQLTLSASTAGDLKRFRYVSGGYAMPLTASGLTASANIAYLETRPQGFSITGTAKQAGISLSYPLVRALTRSADVSLGIDGLDSDNAAFGSLIASERTRAIRLAASYTIATSKRSISVSASGSQGLDVAGARVDPLSAQTGFAKGAASASFAQGFGQRTVLRLTASGQYSRDRLPAAERFSIGGDAIGRAFDTGLLTGDRGGGGSAELAFRPVKRAALATSELYGFVDGGQVTVLARGPTGRQSYSLGSAGFGARARYRTKAELGIEAARTIDKPYPSYADDWRLSVSWRLSI